MSLPSKARIVVPGRMLRAGSIDICQPSVIKIGGIETVAQAAILARAHGVDYVPHCFYFGPGFLAIETNRLFVLSLTQQTPSKSSICALYLATLIPKIALLSVHYRTNRRMTRYSSHLL
jgi:hypothetical protein